MPYRALPCCAVLCRTVCGMGGLGGLGGLGSPDGLGGLGGLDGGTGVGRDGRVELEGWVGDDIREMSVVRAGWFLSGFNGILCTYLHRQGKEREKERKKWKTHSTTSLSAVPI